MKKIRLITVLALFLGVGLVAGCTEQTPLTSEEVVNQIKYCKDNGVGVRVMRQLTSGLIYRTQCEPKEESN